ncbi:adenylate/guanylate cyclase domain-containing protein [Microtetraspora malaysiensis]|uniref:Adenylate/guanylate cyclase domain-containing protein n=1 Tax=Microtetraspora malaysiensis TaxID=161358 RepID=A0ABW6SJC1_9ACTN|nr:adenylate/guanylate cyclase domain-containing protein [Microtetraspora malaysiensis]
MATRRPTSDDIRRLFVGSPPRYTRGEVAAAADLPQEFTGRIWRALGFATLADDAVAFNDGDVDALRRIRAMLETGLLDEQAIVRMARALGRTTSRLAEWQAEIMMGAILEPGTRPSDEDLARSMEIAARFLPDFEQTLLHVWRAQLAATTSRLLAIAEMAEELPTTSRLSLAVGFADMVSFTAFSRQLDEFALADLVEGFEARTSDVIASHGGRLVKTLGDEVLFTATDPVTAGRIALDLVDELKRSNGRGEEGPDVRIGLSYGPVLPVMGDVFGTTVNLAARLTAIARPGAILADAEMAHRLEGAEGVEVMRIRRRPARGLGLVQPYVVRRTSPSTGR